MIHRHLNLADYQSELPPAETTPLENCKWNIDRSKVQLSLSPVHFEGVTHLFSFPDLTILDDW